MFGVFFTDGAVHNGVHHSDHAQAAVAHLMIRLFGAMWLGQGYVAQAAKSIDDGRIYQINIGDKFSPSSSIQVMIGPLLTYVKVTVSSGNKFCVEFELEKSSQLIFSTVVIFNVTSSPLKIIVSDAQIESIIGYS